MNITRKILAEEVLEGKREEGGEREEGEEREWVSECKHTSKHILESWLFETRRNPVFQILHIRWVIRETKCSKLSFVDSDAVDLRSLESKLEDSNSRFCSSCNRLTGIKWKAWYS